MMDYTKQKSIFKIRKVIRYVNLYGISRTYIKVKGQYHKKRIFNNIPKPTLKFNKKMTVGIIGCGNYGYSNLAYYLNKEYGKIIAGCMDANLNRAYSLAKDYKVPFYTDNVDDLINLKHINLIYISSNHSTHAEYAIKALNKGKHVYIEKPHVVKDKQLKLLYDAMKKNHKKVFLGFNRPGSRFGNIIKKKLSEENDSGIYNWFIAGHKIDPDHWYFKPEEGGRVLGNLCHWTDFVFQLVDEQNRYPIEITPTKDITSDANISIDFKFGDGTISTITFSAKGHTFEGVREKFNAHKGNCLISMQDFQYLTVENNYEKKKYRNMFRDQGHKKNICNAYSNVIKDLEYDYNERFSYIVNTANLFLRAKESLDKNEKILIKEAIY